MQNPLNSLLLTALTIALAAGMVCCTSNGGANGDDDVEVPDDAAYLTWDPNEEADLAGYKVHIGTAPSIYDETIDVGLTDDEDAPAHMVEDLDDGTTYYFAITAYDHSGNESGYSDESHKTIGAQ